MRLAAALLALLLGGQAVAAADDGLACRPVAQALCSADGACTQGEALQHEVRFWPEWTTTDQCRAARCPPVGPSIAICSASHCDGGAVHFAEGPFGDPGLRRGIAATASEPAPRLYAARFHALVFEPATGRLTLSRVHAEGLETIWLDCGPAGGG